ncbi:MAG TPA: hypothetical protein VMS31_13735 [Pyrinomonadaceae bacterium]|nr:hypothetical protein [Pyrinomonadaceae bacterium]
MKIGETQSLGKAIKMEAGEAPPNLFDSAAMGYPGETPASQRSVVERRYLRMSEAHDRIRTELLAQHPSRST